MKKIEVKSMLLSFGLILLSQLSSINGNSCSYGSYPEANTCEECGRTYYTPNARIVGGIPVVPHSWPAQVLVQQRIRGDYAFDGFNESIDFDIYCGGTLINCYTVLTAAHCIYKFFDHEINGTKYKLPVLYDYYSTLESMFLVYLGSNDFSTNETTRKVMTVQKLIKHESYCVESLANDIALIILSEPVELDENIQVACLPPKGKFPRVNTSAVAVGWGATYEGGGVNSVLNNVDLKIYDEEKCNYFEQIIEVDFNKQICAGDLNGGKGICQGDSGGGIYIRDPHLHKTVIVGITSATFGCARAGYPAIFTRVSYYYDWIVSNWKLPESSTTMITAKKTATKIISLLVFFYKESVIFQ